MRGDYKARHQRFIERELEHWKKTVEVGRNWMGLINVTGGVGSPRHYSGVNKEQPLLSPSHPSAGCSATSTHIQHNATNTQHYSHQQHTSMIYHNANTMNTGDVANNQFCYDRTSVPLYSSGPGDAQDVRPLPPSNLAGHQLGGKSCDNHYVMWPSHLCVV